MYSLTWLVRPALATALLCVAVAATAADESLLRGKAFLSQSFLPHSDVRVADDGESQQQLSLDLRGQWQREWQGVEGRLAVELTSIFGDGLRADAGAGEGDGLRYFDLADQLSSGERRRVRARVDRLSFGYRTGPWSLRIGRDAVSWGNGQVFQPLDLFSPFAPAETDRDYKAGDDLLLVQRLFDDGSDLQLLAVARRNSDGQRSGSAASFGAKWRGQFENAEFNVLGGRHGRDAVLGLGVSHPIGDAIGRFDLLTTRLDDDGSGRSRWKFSGVANADYSFAIGEKNVFVFGELHGNGFGAKHMPVAFSELPLPLAQRLQRGELFTVGRWYAAAGGSLQWSARITQGALWLQSLQDGSALVQTTLSFDQDDYQRWEGGLTVGLGQRGDEFAGLRALPFRQSPTFGGGTQIYLRWIGYR